MKHEANATVRIMLTKDMEDVAKSCNISIDEYASQYLKMKLEQFSRLSEIIDRPLMRLYVHDRT